MASSPNFQFFLRDEKSHKLNLLPLEKNEQTLIYHQRILQGFFQECRKYARADEVVLVGNVNKLWARNDLIQA